MVICKLSALCVALGLYFGNFVFGSFYHDMPIQACLLVILLILNAALNGIQGTKQVAAFTLPFVLFLIFFGGVFQWLELMGRSDWVQDSLIKAFVFPNSFLAVKLALQAVTFKDILALPMPESWKRPVIVLKAVMEKCTPILHRHRFFMDLSPHFDGMRWSRMRRLGGVIVATYISLYSQTEKTQTLLHHRQRYLRNKQ